MTLGLANMEADIKLRAPQFCHRCVSWGINGKPDQTRPACRGYELAIIFPYIFVDANC